MHFPEKVRKETLLEHPGHLEEKDWLVILDTLVSFLTCYLQQHNKTVAYNYTLLYFNDFHIIDGAYESALELYF